jgi:hypothetical protein
MFEKYITIKDTKVLFGMYPSTGAWYCKDLPADNLKDMDNLIPEAIRILNKYNGVKKEEKP